MPLRYANQGGCSRRLADVEECGLGCLSWRIPNMLLVLIPCFAFQVLDDALGKGRLVRMFFVEREPMTPK